MTKPTAIDITPATAADCSEEWIAARREVIARFGFELRAGEDRTIDIRSRTPQEQLASWDRLRLDPWVRFILPNHAPRFATVEDRDDILRQLTAGQSTP